MVTVALGRGLGGWYRRSKRGPWGDGMEAGDRQRRISSGVLQGARKGIWGLVFGVKGGLVLGD